MNPRIYIKRDEHPVVAVSDAGQCKLNQIPGIRRPVRTYAHVRAHCTLTHTSKQKGNFRRQYRVPVAISMHTWPPSVSLRGCWMVFSFFLRPDPLYLPTLAWPSLSLGFASEPAHLVSLDLGLITGLSFGCWFSTALPGYYYFWLASWTCSSCWFSTALPGCYWSSLASWTCSFCWFCTRAIGFLLGFQL